jgi:TPR repeat protein
LCQSTIKGNPHAAAQLGLMYAVGLDGIKPDLIESYRWYGLAERLGQEGTTEALRLLKQRMTQRQYLDATHLSNSSNDGFSCETATD